MTGAEKVVTSVRPSPCCRAYAESIGKEPSLDLCCRSCADYRAYLEFTRYKREYHPEMIGHPDEDDDNPGSDEVNDMTATAHEPNTRRR